MIEFQHIITFKYMLISLKHNFHNSSYIFIKKTMLIALIINLKVSVFLVPLHL